MYLGERAEIVAYRSREYRCPMHAALAKIPYAVAAAGRKDYSE